MIVYHAFSRMDGVTVNLNPIFYKLYKKKLGKYCLLNIRIRRLVD